MIFQKVIFARFHIVLTSSLSYSSRVQTISFFIPSNFTCYFFIKTCSLLFGKLEVNSSIQFVKHEFLFALRFAIVAENNRYRKS
jgi:hypothetical protein